MIGLQERATLFLKFLDPDLVALERNDPRLAKLLALFAEAEIGRYENEIARLKDELEDAVRVAFMMKLHKPDNAMAAARLYFEKWTGKTGNQ